MINYLPSELIAHIGSFLDPKELRKTFCICREWRHLQNFPFLLQRSYAFFQVAQYKKALHNANQALALNKNNHEVYTLRGSIFLRLMQFDAALADFEQALSLDPTNKLALVWRSDTYRAMGKYEEALAIINPLLGCCNVQIISELVAITPKIDSLRASESEAWIDNNKIAVIKNGAGYTIVDKREANAEIVIYEVGVVDIEVAGAITIPGDINAAVITNGTCYGFPELEACDETQTNLIQAFGLFLRHTAISKDAIHTQAFCVRANIFLEKGSFPKAMNDFSMALKNDPQNIDAICGRITGCIMQDITEFEEDGKEILVSSVIKKALQTHSQNPLVHFLAGMHKMQLAARSYYSCVCNIKSAINHLKNALTITPYNPEILVSLGNAYRMHGDSNKALQSFTKAIELEPRNIPALRSRIKILLILNQPQEALADCEKILEDDAENIDMLKLKQNLEEELGVDEASPETSLDYSSV